MGCQAKAATSAGGSSEARRHGRRGRERGVATNGDTPSHAIGIASRGYFSGDKFPFINQRRKPALHGPRGNGCVLMWNARQEAVKLAAAGYLPVPLYASRKHMDVAAAGDDPLHLASRDKAMKELLFTGLAVSMVMKTPDQGTVEAMFGDSNANIGLVTGHRNLLVLDFDDAGAFRKFAEGNGRLVREAPLVRSPDGWHLYLRTPAPVPTSSVYRGLRRIGHVKSLGGYVVCPPSRLGSGGRYVWEEGHSVFEKTPPEVPGLSALGLTQVSPLKSAYDRALGRGGFVDH